MTSWWVLAAFLASASAYDYPDYASFMELVGRENERGLFPNIFNLASNSKIEVNATCGLRGPESYCKLVEHVFMRQPQCDICDDTHPDKRHPIELAIDGTNNWWQSPSLANGIEYETVTITIDLRQEYQVAYVIVKAGIAPRPGTWVLERSIDGEEWNAWQYFASTESDCQRTFGMPGTPGTPRYTSDTAVICTAYYARLDPLEGGEIHVSLVNGRPGAHGPSKELQDFTRTRFVRLRLLKLRTLNADLMIISGRNHDFVDKSVTRRYFYSIKDISIGGQCICYGHAEACPIDPATGQLRCECKHNTCGESCSECCPLFNQLPWHQGTNKNPHICQPCQCFNHADACEFDADVAAAGSSITPDGIYEGGGRCLDCQHRTRGLNCEECLDQHFRPAGVSHYSPDACQPCDCDELGSVDGSCVQDETVASADQAPGDCLCKPGFGGRRCERCAEGFRNYPTCEPCPCHKAGSRNYATCEDTCVCKANVEGENCDRCKAGFINLDVHDPAGCQPCFCFGMSEQCTELAWPKTAIRTLHGWRLTDTTGGVEVEPEANGGSSLTFNTRQHTQHGLYFWKAPEEFTGNMLTSYGGILRYFVYHVPETTSGGEQPVPVPDIVIQGNGARLEYFSRKQFFSRENVSVEVRLDESEGGWYDANDRRNTVDRRKMMRTLADVQLFLLRAAYNHYQVQSSLYGVSVDSASASAVGEERLSSVEQCTCPPGASGLSCQDCPAGFRRVDNILFEGRCEECSCNGHSLTCDPFTAACTDCDHNTTGNACNYCLEGWYGNPSLGGEAGACSQCACPLTLPSNNFSPSCSLAQYSSGGPSTGGDFVCTHCAEGYVGAKCQLCDDGYFGEPTVEGEVCTACQCNGNIDMAAVGNCDRTTGECLKCTGNTAGFNCERCKDDYFGDAFSHSCTACNCHIHGAVSTSCENATGICECNLDYAGQHCDRCKEGHGDVDSGCPECACNATGSLSDWCDGVSGQCQCRPGVFGKQCSGCKTGYWGFSDEGCKYCGCDPIGSEEDGDCDEETGQCICRPHVIGKSCSRCDDGYFNITSKTGCTACQCGIGSEGDAVCDARSGQCVCKPGVTGLNCDKCAPNHFGLSAEGCQQCPVCPAPGQVCDEVTGECVCPKNTVGELCEDCAVDTWDHHPYDGCKACDCDAEGSNGTTCDLGSGQCHCKKGYESRGCSQCTFAHFEFPTCRQCKCGLAGTASASCRDDGTCSCDEGGQCTCKANVEGKKCKKCHPDSFSLLPDSPLGCVKCFCFGKSEFCVQATYIWQQIYADDRLALFAEPFTYYEEIRGLRVFPQQPPTINSYPTDNTPLYWPLPAHFHGDRVTSYNGFLRFRTSNQDGNYIGGVVRPDPNSFYTQPLVILVGNHRIVLQHFPKDSPPENQRYKVKLREDHWTSRSTPEIPVTRKQLMVALQNVQAVYVRGTFAYGVREATLSDLSLDVGVWDENAESNDTATGVEICGDCPAGYSGSSCQNPAEGYCRKRQQYYLDSEEDLELVGNAEPCACHAHSLACHAETCRCTDCEHHTTGDFCQTCADGFYGDATQGSPEDCQSCACPHVDNSFSPTCRRDINTDKGFVCDRCQEGYTGLYCERCREGFFGDPTEEGGQCQECACHPDGSLDRNCDPVNGQCVCRSGVTGRDCSQCQARHALIGAVCTSCDQGCSLPLLADVDSLGAKLDTVDFSSLQTLPWKPLARVENASLAIEADLAAGEAGKAEAEAMVGALDSADASTARKDAQALADQAAFVRERVTARSRDLEGFIEETQEIRGEMREAYDKAWEMYSLLKNYAARDARGGSIDVEAKLREAVSELKRIKDRDDYLEKRVNRAELELGKSKELLTKMLGKKLNDTVLEELYEDMAGVSEKVEDAYLKAWDSARRNTISAKNITDINKRRTDQYNAVSDNVEGMKAEALDNLQMGEDRVEGARNFNLEAFESHRISNDSLMAEVTTGMDECESTGTQYNQLLRDYHVNHLLPAQRHSDQLQRQASDVQNAFVYTKDASSLALRAGGAYEKIVEALGNSSLAAEAAKAAADATYETAAPTSDDSIVGQAARAKEASLALLEESRGLGASAEAETSAFEERLGNVNLGLVAKEKELEKIRSGFSDLDEHHDAMEVVREKTKAGKAKAEETAAGVERMAERVNRLAAQLKPSDTDGAGIRGLAEKINASMAEVRRASAALNATLAQADKNERDEARLAANLALLKEKIREARDKASKIKLSVKARPNAACVRAYRSPASPSPVTSIELKYRPLRSVPDSLLFLTRTLKRRTQPSEYLALTLSERRFVLHWDIGGGPQTLTLPDNIDWLPELNHWYKISITRRGNSGHLSVSVVEIGKKEEVELKAAMEVSQDFGGDARVFNTRPDITTISLGAAEEERPATAESWELRGTIGELKIGGRPLSLWDFAETSGECEGDVDTYRPSSPLQKGHMFRDGYAQVPVDAGSIYELTRFNLAVRFAAYSPNGLLYFRGEENQDFVSVELVEGRVVLQFNLGETSYVRLESTAASYNDGKLHMVVARRERQNATLIVDESDEVTAEAPGAMTGLNIRDSDHFLGGLPSTKDRSPWSRFGIAWEGFYGCIESVQPDMRFAPLDFSTVTRSLNYNEGCIMKDERLQTLERVVSIGVDGPGYLVLAGLSLPDEGTVGFGFRTAQSNATLLYQSSRVTTYARRRRQITGHGFIAAYLYGGSLVVILGTDPTKGNRGETVLTLRSERTFADSQLHSVFLQRDGDRVSIRVDDVEEASGILTDRSVIGSPRAQLFLGGLPGGTKPIADELPTTVVPLHGCVSDIFLNYERVPFLPEAHMNTKIGSCTIQAVSDIEEPLQADAEHRGAASRRFSFLHADVPTPTLLAPSPSAPTGGNDVEPEEAVSCPVGGKADWGPWAEEAVQFARGEAGESYSEVSLKPLGRINTKPNNMTIGISFRTEKADGLLYYWANKKFEQWIRLRLENGRIVFAIRKRGKIQSVRVQGGGRLDDGNWHWVTMLKQQRDVSVSVDGGAGSGNLENVPVSIRILRRRFFVAGWPTKLRLRRNLTEESDPGFVGCIRDLRFNEQPLNLMQYARGAKSCGVEGGRSADLESLSNSIRVPSDGFVHYAADRSALDLRELELRVEFRTAQAEGRLLVLENAATELLVAAHVSGGRRVELRVERKGVFLAKAAAEAPVILCDSSWHRVVFRVRKGSLSVELDGEAGRVVALPQADELLATLDTPSLYLGGAPAAAFTEKLGAAPSLVGCYRRPVLSFFDLSISSIKRAVIGACPYPEP